MKNNRKSPAFAWSSRSRVVLATLVLTVSSLVVGCNDAPQVARENRRLIESLQTAISTRRADWLELNVKLMDEQIAAGKMSDEEQKAFSAVIAQARDGHWDEAQTEITRLAKAQRPTPEDLERLRSRKLN